MRREYRKAASRLFARSLTAECPGFVPRQVKALVLMGGETVFEWSPSDGLRVYVILVPSPTGHQAFTLEIGWSAAARFPEVTARPSVILAPGEDVPLDVEEGIMRIGCLDGCGDIWWPLPDPAVERPGDVEALRKSLEPIGAEEAAEHVTPAVEAALDSFVTVGLPFIEGLAARYCGRASSPRSS